MAIDPTPTVGNTTPRVINRIAAITGSTATPECDELQQLTVDNYREAISVFSGNPPEKMFIVAYFEALGRGKLPTAGIIQGKIKKGPPNIEDLRAAANRELQGYGYKGLEFFPNIDKDLADVYGAFKRINERTPGCDISVDDISREAGKNLNYVTRALANKDCSRITDLDPSFGRVTNRLCEQAVDVQLAIMSCSDAREEAHKWQVDPDSLTNAKELIKGSLGARHGDDSLVTSCTTADQYAFMVKETLENLLEPWKDITDRRTLLDVRRTKLAKLTHVLQESDGINENLLKTAWCYSRARGNSDKVSTRVLLDEITTQTGTESDLTTLISELKILEKFTGRDFSIDLFDKVKDEVTAKAKFAPKDFERFREVIFNGVASKREFHGIGLTQDTVNNLLETVAGVREQDYTVYKICQELCDANNSVRETDLLPKLNEAGIKVESKDITESLATIERVFNERYTLTVQSTTRFIPTVNTMDQKARRRRGVPLDGHYRDLKAKRKK